MPLLKFDVAVREMSFACECGRAVRVPFEELRPEPCDYCGCGKGWRVVTLEEVAQHRRFPASAGRVPEAAQE